MKISNVEVKDLVNTYGSPLYVYDQRMIEDKLNAFKTHLKSSEFECDVIYASKAFNCKAMLQLVSKMDCSLDVVSGGELYTAYVAGFDMNRVYFHGNNKSMDELKLALKYKVGTIIVDNLMEARLLSELAKNLDYTVSILLRVNPGIEAHTHEYIVTANIDSKFGISIEKKSDILELIQIINACPNLSFDGFHAHIGSQIFDKEAFVQEVNKVCEFVSNLGVDVSTLNFGGGFGAVYTSEDTPIPVDVVCETLIEAVKCNKEKYALNINKICIEPGRSIVAEAGSTIYTVGFMKETPHKNYIFVDGGMSDNIRPALYQAKYACVIDGKENKTSSKHYKVAGKCCESGDVIIEDAFLPEVCTKDFLVVKTTGAYGYSMASHYNKALGLPVIFCKDGKSQCVIRGENYEDLIRLENDLCA